ncbi:hypothetical protein ACQV5M_19250, partial [Leptospira sp. SA-E8]|uniref:hypothetical protein n=1 Tax=Leptospira sp. SA-E8 TaxID=3422259 RepID=UPI003EB6D10E
MQQGAITAGTPSIMLAHRGPGGDDRVYWSIGYQDENNQVSWPRRQSLHEWRSLSGVSVCTMTVKNSREEDEDVVFCAFASTHEEGQIACFRYYRDSSGAYVWSEVEWIGSNMTDRTPHLIVVNGKLRCIHRGNDDYHLFYSERSGSAWEAGSWSNDTRISEGETNCGPGAVVTSDNILHVLFRDSGRTGEIFNVQQRTDTDWWKYSIGGGSTKSTPCALNHLGKTICVKNAGDKDYV